MNSEPSAQGAIRGRLAIGIVLSVIGSGVLYWYGMTLRGGDDPLGLVSPLAPTLDVLGIVALLGAGVCVLWGFLGVVLFVLNEQGKLLPLMGAGRAQEGSSE